MLWDKDVDIFSFTDHDSVGCYQDLEKGIASLYEGVTLIPGVEHTNGDDNHMTKEQFGCADCRAKSCHLGDGKYLHLI